MADIESMVISADVDNLKHLGIVIRLEICAMGISPLVLSSKISIWIEDLTILLERLIYNACRAIIKCYLCQIWHQFQFQTSYDIRQMFE